MNKEIQKDTLDMFNIAANDWLTKTLDSEASLKRSGMVAAAVYTASDRLRDVFTGALPVRTLPLKPVLAEALALWLKDVRDSKDPTDSWLAEAAQNVLPSYS